MFGLGYMEMIIIGAVAVLLFGSRLPSVARSMGQSLTEFKKGMQDLDSDVRDSVYAEPTDSIEYEDRQEPAAPAFTPPPASENEEATEDDQSGGKKTGSSDAEVAASAT